MSKSQEEPDLNSLLGTVARHVGRIGFPLEDAIKRAVKGARGRKCFSFLFKGPGARLYFERRRHSKQNFDVNGKVPATDKEVQSQLRLQTSSSNDQSAHRGLSGTTVRWVVFLSKGGGGARDKEWLIQKATALLRLQQDVVRVGRVWAGTLQDPARTVVLMAEIACGEDEMLPVGCTWQPTGPDSALWDQIRVVSHTPVVAEAPLEPGTELHLNIEDIHFSHDEQSEKFSGNNKTILETTLEILSGATTVDELPLISAVWHSGRWFARTGNRRLAVYRLLRIHAPESFDKIKVIVADIADNFLAGHRGSHGKWFPPKLTTNRRNGGNCNGEWMRIKETGEWVGQAAANYAQDLLSAVVQVRG